VSEHYADPAECLFAPVDRRVIFTPPDPLPAPLMATLVGHVQSRWPEVLYKPSMMWKDLELFRTVYEEALMISAGLLQSV